MTEKTIDFAGGIEFGGAVCKALGLDPNMTSAITIRIRSDIPATVMVARYVTPEQGQELALVFEKYKLINA